MAELYDASNNLITSRVLRVIPQPDVTMIKHRTLDGQHHVQQIGTAAKTADITALVNVAGKDAIDNARVILAPVRVTADGRWHEGVIEFEPMYELVKTRLYRVLLTILVQSEGVI